MSAPEEWTPAERARANIAAMTLAVELGRTPRALTAADREALRAYSGWGGLSLRKLAPRFPEGIPLPDERQLIHDYYTPEIVCDAIARVVAPLLPALAGAEGTVRALEPSAGIGRFLSAFAAHAPKQPTVRWQAVEYSKLSATLLKTLFPELSLFVGPFERWVAENDDERFNLVIANPPYGERGPAKTEDPDRSYRGPVDNAYAYFLRRTLDLLAPQGLGVLVIPSAFLTGTADSQRELRELVLRRHHIAAAFRLPSGIFAGASGERSQITTAKHVLNTDIVFFRARGGELGEVDAGDRFIVDGNYYEQFPNHVLGEEHGGKRGKADHTQTEVAYQVVGRFEGLPELVERAVCSACAVRPLPPVKRRRADASATTPAAKPIAIHWLSNAASLGRRVRTFLADVARGDTEVPALAWQELHEALTDWTKKYGAPSRQTEVLTLAKTNDDVASFLAVFEKNSTHLIPALRTKPAWEPRYKGRPDDVLALAEWTYRQRRSLRRSDLGTLNTAPLFAAGWCEDAPGELVPERDYLTGDLWPKYDRARARADVGDQQAAMQARKLLDVIKPALFDEIEGVSPRQGWVPLELVAEWAAPLTINKTPPKLIRKGGLLQVEGEDYERLDRAEAGIGIELMSFLGWANHHSEMFRPSAPDAKFRAGNFILVALDPDPGAPKTLGTIVKISGPSGAQRESANINRDGESMFEIAIEDQPNIRVNSASVFAPSLDEVRLGTGQRWERQFREWCAADPARRELIETTYQRTFQGYRAPQPDETAIPIARWTKAGFRLHAYQTATLRRLLAARGGLAALDVGLGKTAVGIAAVAAARQEGWAKRPVVLAPNSLAEKWVRDILALLPDYRVGRIGWKKKLITRGKYAGKFTTETDTPADRARTWSAFQAGEYDVVVMTYSTLSRTRMDENAVEKYAARTSAIQRQLILRRRSARRKVRSAEQNEREVKLSEREEAVLKEGVGGWVAEQLELPPGWAHDPGITWEDLNIDLVVVDEAQNFKNLFMPEEREGGVPKFMGNPGAGSGRAWNLDFRAASVRAKTGGAGVVLLSATPAKNSPLEFFNLLRYVDPDAFARMGVEDPEQFIDRYCKVVLKDVISISGEVEQRSAVVGFKNLDELRGVIFRYGDFKTAEQVGLPIPEAKPVRISVELDARQEAKYVRYLDLIEAMRRNPEKGNPLGLMARLNLVAIHPDLDEHYGWRDAPGRPERMVNGRLMPEVPPTTDARKVPSPHSPKLDAVVREILGQSGCGHIVFCDNLAVHRWLQMLLIEAGIPESEIGILNAEAAKTSDERMRIAQAFTGTPAMINGTPVPESALEDAGPDDMISEPVRPTLRVVIANQVAYEGVDLQTETCQIHHVDLPYEPATLQQRAGRAVRQGNKRSELPIKFYIAARSLDGFRFNLIQGKLGWMDALITGTARATNNPAAQEMISIEDLLIELSRDPARTKEMQEAQRARRLQETVTKIAKAASATLRAAAGRFALARETTDPLRRTSLEAEADKLLLQLDDVNRQAWPWVGWAQAARSHSMLVPSGGQSPVYETLRVSYPDALDADRTRYVEFGKSDGMTIGARVLGSASWKAISSEEILKFNLRPEHANVAWPAEDHDVETSLRRKLPLLHNRAGWKDIGWHLAPDSFVQKWWPRSSEMLLSRMGDFGEGLPVPVLVGDVIAFGYWRREGKMPDYVFPPTAAGWAEYLKRAVAGDKLKGSPGRAQIAEVSLWWWGRLVPRDLFIEAEFADAMKELKDALAEFDKSKSNRVAVAMKAIEANVLRPIDDATLQRVAVVLEGLDDHLLTEGLSTAKVRSLIALRQRMPRASAPSSQRVEAASTRAPAASTRMVAVPASSAAPSSPSRTVPPPPPSQVRPSSRTMPISVPSSGASSQHTMNVPESRRAPALSARAEAMAEGQRPSRKTAYIKIEGSRQLVNVLAREGDLIVHETVDPHADDGPYAVTHEPSGLRLYAFPTLAEASAFAWDASHAAPRELLRAAYAAHREAQEAQGKVGKGAAREAKRLTERAKKAGDAFVSYMNGTVLSREHRWLQAKGGTPDSELLAALELDPELAGALELDGDDDALRAALELDPELAGALELDEVALG